MTPLELLAVGVSVVLVWSCGFYSGNRWVAGESPRTGWFPLWLGLTVVLISIKDLVVLGIKEAAK